MFHAKTQRSNERKESSALRLNIDAPLREICNIDKALKLLKA
jgi:hypothetical protein